MILEYKYIEYNVISFVWENNSIIREKIKIGGEFSPLPSLL
jgi:hypothetical protein